MGHSQSRIRCYALEEEIITYARMLHSEGGSFEILISGAGSYELLQSETVQEYSYPSGDDYYTVRGLRDVVTQLAFIASNVNARVTLYEVQTSYSACGNDLRGSVPSWAKVFPLEMLKKVVVKDMEKKFGSEFRKLVLGRCMHDAAKNESVDAAKKELRCAGIKTSRVASLRKKGGAGVEKLPPYEA